MHSAIQGTFRKREIALSSDYLGCIKQAQGNKPYKVVEVVHTDIMDYSKLNEEAFRKDAFKGIIKTHFIRYVKEEQIIISMNDFIEEPLKEVVWRKRGAPRQLSRTDAAYNAPSGIDKD